MGRAYLLSMIGYRWAAVRMPGGSGQAPRLVHGSLVAVAVVAGIVAGLVVAGRAAYGQSDGEGFAPSVLVAHPAVEGVGIGGAGGGIRGGMSGGVAAGTAAFGVGVRSEQDLDWAVLNAAPWGIWADADTVWVVNDGWGPTNRVYAYSRSDGSHDPGKGIDIDAAGNRGPRGIWSDGTTMFVVDDTEARVYAYRMSDGSHDPAKDVDLMDIHDNPRGIWGNDSTIWVVNDGVLLENRAYAYRRSDGSRVPAADFRLHDAGNTDPTGVWSDGSLMWVADHDDDKLYAYHQGTGERQPDSDIALDIGKPRGLWGDGAAIWVLNRGTSTNQVFTYPVPEVETALVAVTLEETDSTSATVRVWLAHPDGEEHTIYLRYQPYAAGDWEDVVSKEGEEHADFSLTGLGGHRRVRVQASFDGAFSDGTEVTADLTLRPTDLDIFLGPDNPFAVGVWSEGTTVFVVDQLNRVHAYVCQAGLENCSYDSAVSFDLDEGNTEPKGVFADGDTMWVVDNKDYLYAYTIIPGVSYGTYDADATRALLTDDGWPTGVWSDGDTVWVASHVGEKLYGYPIGWDGALDHLNVESIELYGVFGYPRGVWSDGDTIWVADDGRDRLFAYRLTDDRFGERQPARDVRLDGHNRDPWGIWSDGSTMWVADSVDDRLYAYWLPRGSDGDVLDVMWDTGHTDADITVVIDNPDGEWRCATVKAADEPGHVRGDRECTSGTRLYFNMAGLHSDTEYELLVDLEDGGTLSTGGFKTWSRAEQAGFDLRDDVVPTYEEDWPWLRETYREMRRQNLEIKVADLGSRTLGRTFFECDLYGSVGLPPCDITILEYDHDTLWQDSVHVHELGHVYTRGTDYPCADFEYCGMGWLYFRDLTQGGSNCDIAELYADTLEYMVTYTETYYFEECSKTPDDPSSGTRAVVNSVLDREIPDWFDDEYGTTGLAYDTSLMAGYDRMYDLEQVWADLKKLGQSERATAVYSFRTAFGGYCDETVAAQAAFDGGVSRNPWRVGGCGPYSPPLNLTARDAVEWLAPAYDGGAPVTKWVVEWKGRGEDFDAARSAEVGASGLSYQHAALASAEWVRVTGHNDHGAGGSSLVVAGANEVLWSAFLAPGEFSFGWGFLGVTGTGSLTSDNFVVGSTEYEISSVFLNPYTDLLSLTLRPRKGLAADFEFYVGNVRFAKGDAYGKEGSISYTYEWTNPGLSWSVGKRVPLRLVVSNSPPVGAPVISGVAQVGEPLVAVLSGVGDADGVPAEEDFSYQWVATDGVTQWDIADATDSTYVPVQDDLGMLLRVRVGFTDDAGFPESVTSEATGGVTTGAMVWAALMTVGEGPSVSGYAPHLRQGVLSSERIITESYGYAIRSILVNRAGELVLTLDREFESEFVFHAGGVRFPNRAATGKANPSSYTYRWDNSGLGWSDGERLVVAVSPNRTAVGVPTIDGVARVGERLVADISGISDPDGLPPGDGFGYQWSADDGTGAVDIPGATGSSYTPVAADVGNRIRVRVTFVDNSDHSEVLTSSPTRPVRALSYGAIIWSATLTVGTNRSGGDTYLGYENGERGSLDPDGFSYEGSDVGVTALQYVVGDTLRLVTDDTGVMDSGRFILYLDGTPFSIEDPALDTDGRLEFPDHGLSWTRGRTVEVRLAANRTPVGVPVVEGLPQVGWELRGSTSGISDPDGIGSGGFAYQWVAGDGTTDVDIAGATDARLRLGPAEEGKQVKLRVSYMDGAGFGESVTSEPTLAVTGSSDVTPPAFVSGACTAYACELGFYEVLDNDAHHQPPLDAFVLAADGEPIGVEELSYEGPVLTLLFENSVILFRQDLSLAYTDPTTGNDDAAIQDLAGNDAASFTATLANWSELSVPFAPLDLAATADGQTTIGLSWTEPAYLGGVEPRDVYYTIEVSVDEGMTWEVLRGDHQDTAYTHTGLRAGDTRHYRVFAFSYLGDGPYSDVVSSTTVLPTVPDPPTEVRITDMGIDRLTVRWGPPHNDGGSPISGYRVRWKTEDRNFGGDPSREEVTEPTATSHTIEGLTTGVFYSVVVLATNGAGDSIPSTVVGAVPSTVPDAPLPEVTAGDSELAVSWDTPYDGGRPVTDYTIQWRASTVAGWDTAHQEVIDAPTGGYTIEGLTNGNAYTIRLKATNPVGDSAWSPEATGTPQYRPTLSAVAIDSESVTRTTASVTVTLTNPGSTIQAVHLRYRASSQTAWTAATSVSTTATSATFPLSGLSGNTAYEVQASLDGDFRLGVGSATFTTGPTEPAPPTGLSVTGHGDQQLTVAWNPPEDNGGSPLTGYRLEWKSGDHQFGGDPSRQLTVGPSTRARTIGGLVNGDTYVVRVVATNLVGDSPPSNTATDTPSTTPHAPGNVTVTAGDSRLTISWAEPHHGASHLAGYKVQWRSGRQNFGDPTRQLAAGPSATSRIIDGLTNGDTYTLRVIAVNADGESPPSAEVTAIPVGPPEAPTSLRAGPRDRSLHVTWAEPPNGGRTITGYTVQWRSGNQQWSPTRQDTTTPPDRSHTIGGLTNRDTYTLRVRATNSEGDGDWSAEITAVPWPKPPPTVTVTADASEPIRAPFTLTFTFSEEVTGFEAGDILAVYVDGLLRAEIGEFTETRPGLQYTARVETIVKGLLAVVVPDSAAQATDTGLGNVQANRSFDIAPPSPEPGPQPGTDIWHSTMTVGDIGGYRGAGSITTQQQGGTTTTISGGSLTDNDFDLSATTYAVIAILASQAEARISIDLSQQLPPDANNALTLHLGDMRLDFADANQTELPWPTGARTYSWSPLNPDWSIGDHITIRITQ